jgi:hypothetical protein
MADNEDNERLEETPIFIISYHDSGWMIDGVSNFIYLLEEGGMVYPSMAGYQTGTILQEVTEEEKESLEKAIEKKLGAIRSSAEKSMEEITVPWKLFDCMSECRWYIFEYNPETEEAFGLMNLGDYQNAELGCINLKEIKRILGWRLERDQFFTPMNLKELYNKIKSGKHV